MIIWIILNMKMCAKIYLLFSAETRNKNDEKREYPSKTIARMILIYILGTELMKAGAERPVTGMGLLNVE
ncbi:MAG: hypothetical protein JJE18_09150 [Eubacteriaceae bacterium]|nr:hypothetical protein [Eubacteriaceae bacterium]